MGTDDDHGGGGQLASLTGPFNKNSTHQTLFSDLQSSVNWQRATSCRPNHTRLSSMFSLDRFILQDY